MEAGVGAKDCGTARLGMVGIVLKLQVLHQPPFALKVAYHGFILKGWTLEVVKFVEHRRNSVALFTKDTVELQFLAEQCFKYI